MITEKATFTFYNVRNAGFYRAGASVPEFGSLSETLIDLNCWAAEKVLKETKTFEADEERYPAYLVDSKNVGDDWLLLLWNEVPSNGQRMPSLSEDAVYGADPEVIMNPIRERTIPGFATYFWFIADRNLLCHTLQNEGKQFSFQHHSVFTGIFQFLRICLRFCEPVAFIVNGAGL